MEKSVWEKWAAMLICIAFLAFAVIMGFRYLFPVLLPFLIAWGLSLVIRPLAGKLSVRLRLPKKLCATLLLLLFLGLLFAIIWLSIDRLAAELGEFVNNFLDRSSDGAEENRDFFAFAAEKIPFLARFSAYREEINQLLADSVSGVMVTLSAELPNLIASLLSALPDLLFVVLITVISGFYFCTSENDLLHSLVLCLPVSVQKRLPVWKGRIKTFSWRFLRAYLLLLLLTFALLLAGFLILRQKYAFLLALVIALVDLLPVLGVGTVLVPWACIAFVSRQYFFGVGLLILYVVVLVVRQVVEPKVLGKSFGLHPVFALFATFAGWYLFGFLGMLISPIVAVLIKLLLESGKTEKLL